MKKTIKFITLALTLALMFSISITAKADTEIATANIETDKYFTAPTYNTKLNDALSFAWDNYLTYVDVSAYKIKLADFDSVYGYIVNLYPEYFYIADTLQYSYSTTTSYIISISPEYSDTISNIKKQRTKFNNAANSILAKIGSSMRDEDKIVFIHDYISTHNTYDPDGLSSNIDNVDSSSFTAYGCLVNHVSVCQGMSDAFMYLAKQAGLYSSMVLSADMCHAWNLVNLNGSYYQLDITWDDSSIDLGLNFLNVNGVATHSYFMKSDSQMTALEHYNWDSDYKASNSTTLSNYYWNDVNSSIYLIKGYQYYIKNSQIIKRDYYNNTTKVLYNISSGNWQATNGKTYTFNSQNSILTYDYNNNFLLFLQSDGVYAINLYTLDVSKVFSLTGKGYIGGISFYDNTLYYDKFDYESTELKQTADLTTTISYPNYSVLYGDVNEDGYVNVSDLLSLNKKIVNMSDDYNEFTSDVNEDNEIDLKDLLLMKKYVAGYVVTFGN